MKRFFLFFLIFSLLLGSVSAQESASTGNIFSESEFFFGVSGFNQFIYSLSGSLPSQSILPDGYNCDSPLGQGEAKSGLSERKITHNLNSGYDYLRIQLKDITRGGMVGAKDIKQGEAAIFSGLDTSHTYQWFSFSCTNLAKLGDGSTAVGQVCYQGTLCQNTLQNSNGAYLCDLNKWVSCPTGKCGSTTSCEASTVVPSCTNGIQKCDSNKVVECSNSRFLVKSDCGSNSVCQQKTATTSICQANKVVASTVFCLSSDK